MYGDMKTRTIELYKHFINFFANLITIIVEATLFGVAWYILYIPMLERQFYRRGNWAVIGFYVLILFFFTNTFGGYKIGYKRIQDIILSHFLGILCGTFVGYFEICLVANDYLDPKPLLAVALAELIFIVPWTFIVRKVYAWVYPPREMLVIYGNYSPDDLMSKINSRKDKYNICGSISCEEKESVLYATIDKYGAIVLADLPALKRNEIMKYCYRKSIRTYVTPKISDILLRGSDDIHLFDTPLLLSRNYGLSIDQRFLKRIMDIVLAILGLILAAPFMIIIAIAIKICDGGPILYTQDRLTRDGKEFKMYKFRSMYIDSEKKGARLAAKGDDRITPVGKIIRNIHFDELPQIFNILSGDMAIVGPRPERKIIAEQYMEEIPEFDLRLKVKAGLTGYAQVYGKYNTTPYDKLKLDLTYIENYNIWMDIKILFLTFKILFVKDSTEGVDASQQTALKHTSEKEK